MTSPIFGFEGCTPAYVYEQSTKAVQGLLSRAVRFRGSENTTNKSYRYRLERCSLAQALHQTDASEGRKQLTGRLLQWAVPSLCPSRSLLESGQTFTVSIHFLYVFFSLYIRSSLVRDCCRSSYQAPGSAELFRSSNLDNQRMRLVRFLFYSSARSLIH